MRKYIIMTLLLTSSHSVSAQSYMEQDRTRHRFAQLLLGVDYRFMPGVHTQSAVLNGQLQPESFTLPIQREGRLIIGGTHFWGRADFYVAFPVMRRDRHNFSSGVETGAKYYPWRIEQNKVRPFVGLSLNTTGFKHQGGPNQIRFAVPLQAGISFFKNNHLLEAGLTYHYRNRFDYYISRTQEVPVRVQPLWLNISYKYMLDHTVGEEKAWLDGSTWQKTRRLAAEGKLNSFSLAIGPSSTWFTKPSDYNNTQHPFLGNHKVRSGFFDFGIGYYFHRPDIHINLTYRNIDSEINAYGLQQRTNRKALTLEAYKYLFDFHGFVPFIGPAISRERLSVEEYDGDVQTASGSFEGFKPGITFGWDIRPNRIQAWLVRTNLRYFPNLNVQMPNAQAVSLDQIEFNFIQLVIYPQRFGL